MKSSRELIKSEFKYYLSHIARSSRRTSEGYNLGKTAVDSFLIFIEPNKLFDYDPDKWSYIESMYDITDCIEVKHIADELLNDEKFIEHDIKNNQGWRSGSLMHYVCFINARSFFTKKEEKEPITYSGKPLQQIYYGAPGTGKSHIINKTTCGESVIRTTFHPDSDYSSFVGCYKPTTKTVRMRDMAGHVIRENGEDVTEDRIVYEFVDQAFLQAYINAWKFYDAKNEEIKNQFLVIEEINRGNCAQIFGDLFQLLDRNTCGFSDYPIHADNDMHKHLAKALNGITISEENKNRINACYKGGKDYVSQVLNGEILLLPDNLYIWATMNTSDQSLFPIDSAFKRRWDWQYMPIAKGRENGNELNWRIIADSNQYDWWSFLTKINEQIGSTTNSEDKKLGFFFCKAVNGTISAETFVGKVIFYLWNDVFKDFGFEGTIFNDEDGSTLSFDKFYTTDKEGKVIVKKDKVQLFLENLKVEVASVQDNELQEDYTSIENTEDSVDDEEEDNTSQKKKDNSRYSINGDGAFRKRNLAEECVKLYIANNPEMPTSQIVDNWMDLKIKVPYLIETEEDFERREKEGNDTRFRLRAFKISLNNGDNIYVTNQFNVERTQDFIEKVNATDWGIKVEKIE